MMTTRKKKKSSSSRQRTIGSSINCRFCESSLLWVQTGSTRGQWKDFQKEFPPPSFAQFRILSSRMNTLCVHIFPLPRSLCCPLSLAHTHTQLCIKKEESTARISLFIATYTAPPPPPLLLLLPMECLVSGMFSRPMALMSDMPY